MNKIKLYLRLLQMGLSQISLPEITRSGAFLGSLGVCLYLFATNQTVPQALLGISAMFAGYYFRGIENNVLATRAHNHVEGIQN